MDLEKNNLLNFYFKMDDFNEKSPVVSKEMHSPCESTVIDQERYCNMSCAEGDDDHESLLLNSGCHVSSQFSSSYNHSSTDYSEELLRRKLKFFFMNPIEKWQTRQRFPYKFIVQVIKIILVTVQLCLFAHSRYNHVNYTWDNRVAFFHLFLKNWDPIREINAYPPSIGPLAVYEIKEFYSTIDFSVVGYANVYKAIGSYSYTEENDTMAMPVLCLHNYKEGIVYGFNESYVFNGEIVKHCYNLSVSVNSTSFSIEDYLKEQKIEIIFSALVEASLHFSLKTVNFKAAGVLTSPDCYRFDIVINFNNNDHDGQMLLSLDAEPVRLFCHGDVEYIVDSSVDYILRSILNSLVIIVCCISLILCCRAIYRAQRLKCETVAFFQTTYGKQLSVEGRLEFLNFWYVMIITNDILIVMGSAIKEQIEKKSVAGDQWNICSVFLGTGNLLVWFGVLRYLGFFKTYNVVILTLRKAAPKIARFLSCVLLIYAGFVFCGWLVLGPYHIKFRSLSTTSECLFALINGDDIFATFDTMTFKAPMLWWYSRIYLYSFITLYIYVVLSLFISVIMDAYETIKVYYQKGFPKNDLQIFVAGSSDETASPSRISNPEQTSFLTTFFDKLCSCQRQRIM